jgi:hypothetical protein
VKAELRKLVGIFSTRWRAEESCPACGEKFACGATLAGCWCREVKLSDNARAELQQRYKGCLCRACLEKFAAESWSHGKEARPKEEMPG